MELRMQEKRPPKPQAANKEEQKPKLQIVRLEERIAPKLGCNHNETLVRA